MSCSYKNSKMTLIEKLSRTLGLTKYEAKVYQAAVTFDLANLSDLARRARIPRTAAYVPVQSLVQKSILSVVPMGKRKYYQAIEPAELKHVLERRMVDLEEVVIELSKNTLVKKNKLSIRYFAGDEGMKIASDILLNFTPSHPWKTIENPTLNRKATSAKQIDEYTRKRIGRGISGRCIMAKSAAKTSWLKNHLKEDKRELRKTLLIDDEKFPIEASLVTTGDTVLILTAKENPGAILIKNEDLAKTIESMHDLIWEKYKK